MALVTNQLLGSYKGFPSWSLSLNKGSKLEPQLISSCAVGKSDKFTSPKRHLCVRLGSHSLCFPKVRSLRISSFKGSAQNDGSGARTAKVSRNSVRVSDITKQNDETSTAEDLTSHPTETDGDKIGGSPASHRLFRKWVTMLINPPAIDGVIDDILGEGPPPMQIAKINCQAQFTEKNGVLKTLWCHFCDLDATVKIPLLVFIPFYVAVNVVYGSEVSKQLTPFWVLGPLVVAVYIKMLRALCSLYVFTFRKTAEVVKNIPAYYLIACNYVFHGKLKEDVVAQFWQPLVDIRNLDYNQLTRRKLGEFQEWLMEKYSDYVESIWPYYCRTIRFLKRANLI